MKQAYTVLSKLYDKLMVDFNYQSYYHFISNYIKGNVLELACGSGMFTKQYIANADNIIALDNCNEMLSIALKNNYKDRKYINFIQADMLTFVPNKKLDTVLCVCDGINYISQTDIDILFGNVFSYLNRDSYFIFDISSEYKLKEIIASNVFYEDNDEFTYLWTNELKKNSIEMDITLFNRVSDVYTREDEVHRQFIHNTIDIVNALEKAGFEVRTYDGENFNTNHEHSKRVIYICYKR